MTRGGNVVLLLHRPSGMQYLSLTLSHAWVLSWPLALGWHRVFVWAFLSHTTSKGNGARLPSRSVRTESSLSSKSMMIMLITFRSTARVCPCPFFYCSKNRERAFSEKRLVSSPFPICSRTSFSRAKHSSVLCPIFYGTRKSLGVLGALHPRPSFEVLATWRMVPLLVGSTYISIWSKATSTSATFPTSGLDDLHFSVLNVLDWLRTVDPRSVRLWISVEIYVINISLI